MADLAASLVIPLAALSISIAVILTGRAIDATLRRIADALEAKNREGK